MKIKKPMFKLKATMLAVLMATSTSINAIDADVKTDLLARYPNMSSLSDAQLSKVVDLLNRFPGLKNLNQKDIDSIKERIEDRRASGNRVLGSGRVIKKLIEVNPDLLANIDPDRFRMRLSRSANGSLSIKEDLTAQFENMSKDEMKERWVHIPIMDKIAVLKAFREKVQEIREDGDWETNRELLVNYVYENKLTPEEQKRYDDKYFPKPNEGDILKDLTGEWDDKNGEYKPGKEPNWTMFWMLPPETRREVYRSWGPGDAHFDDFANPDSHKDRDTSDKYDGFDNLYVEGIQGTHISCTHDKNKFWNAFAEQYPRAWEGWFKENIWNQNLADITPPIPDPSNFPSDKLKDRLKDWVTAKWPPLPPDLEISKEILIGLIENAKPGFELPDEGPVLGQELPDVPDVEIPGRDQSIINKIRDKLASIDWAPGREPPKLTPDQWEFLWANITGPGFELPGEQVGNELPDVPDSIPERPVSELDRDKIQNLIDYLQNRPGWEPLPPLLEANMDDLITLLQGYQRVDTPNAEELLRRSKKTSGGS